VVIPRGRLFFLIAGIKQHRSAEYLCDSHSDAVLQHMPVERFLKLLSRSLFPRQFLSDMPHALLAAVRYLAPL